MHMTPDVSMTWSVLFIGLIVAGVLVCGTIGTVAYVLMKANNKTISPRQVVPHLVGLLWILPVVAVFLILVLPVVWLFLRYPSHRIERPAHDEVVVSSDRSGDSVTVEHEVVDYGTPPNRMPDFPGTTTERVSDTLTTSNDGPSEIIRDTSELPAWVRAGESNAEDSRLLVLASKQFAKVDRARQNVLRDAARVVREDFQRNHKGLGSWTLPDVLVQEHAVRQEYVEEIARTTDVNTFLVYRVYYQVELSPTVRAAVFENWRGQTVTSRLWMLGGLLGFVTLVLGTTATYLRLDAVTNGAYRRRLKLASVSLLVAGGIGLAALLPLS